MVFIQRDIITAPEYVPVDPSVIAQTAQEHVLDVTTAANIAGVINQIALLSKHAVDMFSSMPLFHLFFP